MTAEPDAKRQDVGGGMGPPYALEARDLGVEVHARPVLAGVSLSLPKRGISWLVGPVAAGKSTLLRALAGLFEGKEGYVQTGRVTGPAGARGPRLVAQQSATLLRPALAAISDVLPERGAISVEGARALAAAALVEAGLGDLLERDTLVAELELFQRRLLSIAQAAASGADVILVDEPTASLNDDGRANVLRYLTRLQERTSLLVVTHNQADLRAVPGAVHLLVAGRLVDVEEAASFLEEPRTPEAASFVGTGTVGTASLSARPQELGQVPVSPSWLQWVIPERLAGAPRPGILRPLEEDFAAMQRAGVANVYCLEETLTYDVALARAYGLTVHHHPIADMGALPGSDLSELARAVRSSTDEGSATVVHCRGGLGRTGMVLAAVLVLGGRGVDEAVAHIRKVEPRFIQVDAQLEALRTMAGTLPEREVVSVV